MRIFKNAFLIILFIAFVCINLPAYCQTPSNAFANIAKIKSDLLSKKQQAQEELSTLNRHLQKVQSFISSLNSDTNRESLEISRQAEEKDKTAILNIISRIREIERRLMLAEKAGQHLKNPAGEGEWLGGRFAITDMKGDIRVLRKGVAQEIKPAQDMILGPGDKISTGAAGEISLVMVDGSRVEIRENSQFEIGANSSDLLTTKLTAGKIKAYVHKMLYRRYEVHTPTIAVSIRGTEFEVEVDKDGFSRVTVLEGAVEVRKIIPLSQGQSWSDKQ